MDAAVQFENLRHNEARLFRELGYQARSYAVAVRQNDFGMACIWRAKVHATGEALRLVRLAIGGAR